MLSSCSICSYWLVAYIKQANFKQNGRWKGAKYKKGIKSNRTKCGQPKAEAEKMIFSSPAGCLTENGIRCVWHVCRSSEVVGLKLSSSPFCSPTCAKSTWRERHASSERFRQGHVGDTSASRFIFATSDRLSGTSKLSGVDPAAERKKSVVFRGKQVRKQHLQ